MANNPIVFLHSAKILEIVSSEDGSLFVRVKNDGNESKFFEDESLFHRLDDIGVIHSFGIEKDQIKVSDKPIDFIKKVQFDGDKCEIQYKNGDKLTELSVCAENILRNPFSIHEVPEEIFQNKNAMKRLFDFGNELLVLTYKCNFNFSGDGFERFKDVYKRLFQEEIKEIENNQSDIEIKVIDYSSYIDKMFKEKPDELFYIFKGKNLKDVKYYSAEILYYSRMSFMISNFSLIRTISRKELEDLNRLYCGVYCDFENFYKFAKEYRKKQGLDKSAKGE